MRELCCYREMILNLIKRDLKSRYKGSFLGVLWMLLNPLLQLCIYTIVFSVFMRMNIEKYYLFLFVALVPWMFFSSCLSLGTTVIIGQQDLLKKIYFPREVLPIAFTTSQFVNLILSFVVIFIVLFLNHVILTPIALLFLFVIMIFEYMLSLGIAFLVSGLTVYFRDLQHILGIISLAWMYMTPVVYSEKIVPVEYRHLYYLNPMTSIIISYRDILYYERIPDVFNMVIAGVLSLLVLLAGVVTFHGLQKGFAEEL